MRQRQFWSVLFKVIVLFIALVLAAWFILQFSDSNFVLGVIGAVVAIITASMQYRAAKDRESDARLFAQKQEVYSDLIETVMGLFGGVKGKSAELTEMQLAEKLQSIRTKLLVWGSFETLNALNKLSYLGSDSAENQLDVAARGSEWLSELFRGIRRDLGHKDPADAHLELALSILNEPDRTNVRNRIKRKKNG
ncbi:MAG: hypothetical protein AAGG45_07965 [Pseudomonadota bacterium]